MKFVSFSGKGKLMCYENIITQRILIINIFQHTDQLKEKFISFNGKDKKNTASEKNNVKFYPIKY